MTRLGLNKSVLADLWLHWRTPHVASRIEVHLRRNQRVITYGTCLRLQKVLGHMAWYDDDEVFPTTDRWWPSNGQNSLWFLPTPTYCTRVTAWLLASVGHCLLNTMLWMGCYSGCSPTFTLREHGPANTTSRVTPQPPGILETRLIIQQTRTPAKPWTNYEKRSLVESQTQPRD